MKFILYLNNRGFTGEQVNSYKNEGWHCRMASLVVLDLYWPVLRPFNLDNV